MFILGKLVEWSMVLYGTSTHPYIRHEQPRSALLPSEDDTTEEYNGDLPNSLKAKRLNKENTIYEVYLTKFERNAFQ